VKQQDQFVQELIDENQNLKERLSEAEQTIQAIQRGEVDALVVNEPAGDQVYTLKGADFGYRVLVESMNEGALILSSDDSIYYCNNRLGEMLDLPIEKITGTVIGSYVAPDANSGIVGLIRESRIFGKAEGEFMFNRSDGTLLPVKLSLKCLNLEGFTGVCGVLTDLSKQKKTEQKLKIAAAGLQRSNEELQDFAFIASHDLQEPLRKIQTFGTILIKKHKESLDPQGQDYMARVIKAANRMSELLRSLLHYSRTGTSLLNYKPISLTEVAKDAADDLEISIHRAKGSVQISEMPTVEADATLLRQLFQNIIGNSIKYRKEAEPLIVKIYGSIADAVCHVFIEDNGIGFDECYSQQIFKPFERLHGRSASYTGTGMGLAICRKIVARHHGEITVHSIPGQGTTFIVTLPTVQKAGA
jgi:PAS domain S-box-containing protein